MTKAMSTLYQMSRVGAARKVSPNNWSQEMMTCHFSNCFRIVWDEGNAPRVQRKSVLRLAIQASCCLYVLAQESFYLAQKRF